MILRLVHPGRPFTGPLADAAADYRRRVDRHLRTEEVLVKPERPDRPGALDVEAERVLSRVGPRDHLVALLVDGDAWSSEELARRLERWLLAGPPATVLALGSASGLGREVVAAARERWSLGPLTLPHDLARVVVWEQVYRAGAILRGEPYHRG